MYVNKYYKLLLKNIVTQKKKRKRKNEKKKLGTKTKRKLWHPSHFKCHTILLCY